MNAKPPYDVLVVGGGPAGAAAAIYAARKGIRTGIAAERLGGQLLDTVGIENFISVKETQGHKLATGLDEHVNTYEVDVMNLQRAAGLVPGKGGAGADALIEVKLASGAALKAKSVVIATGARWREINVPGEREYRNRGVAYCPHCDGPLYKGKRVAVIGGGNSGVEAAIDLAGLVSHVTVIEYESQLRADAVLTRKLAEPRERRGGHECADHRSDRRWAASDRSDVQGSAERDDARAGACRGLRADRPRAEHRLAQRHRQALAARRDRSGCAAGEPHSPACSPRAIAPSFPTSKS